jgi:surface antigen
MKQPKIIPVILCVTMLTACTEPNGAPGKGILNGGSLNKTDVGTAVGVVGGGVLGSAIGGGVGRVAATIGGALLGGYLGNSVGKSLDNADLATYDQASQRAMETGHSQSWKNSSTGHHGTVYPQKSYVSETGDTCRAYTQTIVIDGKSHKAHGTACRMDDGTWEIVD